jgi:LytS/YehU family sensor histidine kinase
MGFKPPMEQADRHQQPHFNEPSRTFDDERLPFDGPLPQNRQMRQMRHHDGPPPIVGERDILAIIVLILMFGANLGIKSYFRSRDDRKRLEKLERENLAQQLEYLRYQINPHFFMNTLNNIHALVDINPEQAKDTILELSKMMRFVLYEGNKQGVPLSRELDFIRHYVALMQLRYTNKVKITLDLPQSTSDRQIPPLILITFIENAFKHGISYQHPSFIEISVSEHDGAMQFSCRNSKGDTPLNPPQGGKTGGVGLANIRKRLNLLYGHDYALRIKNDADTYSVELSLPFTASS